MNFNNKNPLKVSVVIAGFTALIVQIIFLREFLTVFLGNELVAGVIIGNWMLLTAAGTRIGSKVKTSKNIPVLIIIAQLFIAVLPQISVLLLGYFKSKIYPPGVLPGFVDTWFFSFLLMAPFCLVSGALFALFLKAFGQISNNSKAPLIYGFEAVGSVAGGILFTFLFLSFFTTSQTLLLLATANFGISLVLVLASKIRRLYFHLILILSILLVAVNLIFDFDKLTKSFIYGKQEIVLNEETPYGNLIVTKTGSQYNFFENGLSLFSTNNTITNEESVHYAMLQHPDPRRVLIVSGGISGMIDEVLKYKVAGIDYVEINPAIVEAGKRFTGFAASELLEIHNNDARTFIKQTDKKFDVVLLNLPPPSTAQINCYFTQEFYRDLKSKLNPGAVISTSLDGGSNYLGKEAAKLHGILFLTMKSVFTYVLIIPGQVNYFLASDATLSANIIERLESKDFENDYVNKYYLDDKTLKLRTKQLLKLIPADSPINRDFQPVGYFARIDYWLSWFGIKIQKIAAFVAGVFLVVIFFLNKQNKSMVVAGFTSSATEIMVLLGFQVVFGYFYQAMALLIAAFMAGLAMGTYLSGKDYLKYNRTKMLINQAMIGVFAIVVPCFLVFESGHFDNEFMLQAVFYVFMIVPGVLTGLQFSWVSMIGGSGNSERGSATYSADLIGSAGGALLASVILIPLNGFIITGLFLLGINWVIILINLFTKK